MSIYQIGYYRNKNAGYQSVAPSLDMSKNAVTANNGIVSNVINKSNDLKANGEEVPDSMMGVIYQDIYAFITKINMSFDGTRRVGGAHSYCMSIKEFYELAKTPEKILGIKSEVFPTEHDENIKNYPSVESLPYDDMNVKEIISRYGFSKEDYKHLIWSSICAIEGYSNPMCIVYDGPVEGYERIYRDVMFLILSGLPYHMRIRPSLFSNSASASEIYISKKAEGNNVFDLNTKQASCDYKQLQSFGFTQLYATFEPGSEQFQMAISRISQFVDDAINISYKKADLKTINCQCIQAGFEAALKNLIGQEINPNDAVDLLTAFLGFELKEGSAADTYIIKLLQIISKNDFVVAEERVKNKLRNKYLGNCSDAYAEVYFNFFTHQHRLNNSEQKEIFDFIRQEEKKGYAFEKIYRNEKNRQFYLEGYIPYRITSFKEVGKYIADFSGQMESFPEIYEKVLDCTVRCFAREIKTAKTLKSKYSLLLEGCDFVNHKNSALEEKYFCDMEDVFVNNISSNDVRVGEVRYYEENRSGILAIIDKGRRENRKLQYILNLWNAVIKYPNKGDYESLADFFYAWDKYYNDVNDFRTYLKEFRTYNADEKMSKTKYLDMVLASCMDPISKRVNIHEWISFIVAKNRAVLFEKDSLKSWIYDTSFKGQDIINILSRQIEEGEDKDNYASEEWSCYKNLAAVIKKYIKSRYSSGAGSFSLGMLRMAVMFMAVTALTLNVHAIFRYTDYSDVIKMVYAITLPVLILIAYIARGFVMGFGELFEGLDLYETKDTVIYFGVLSVMGVFGAILATMEYVGGPSNSLGIAALVLSVIYIVYAIVSLILNMMED